MRKASVVFFHVLKILCNKRYVVDMAGRLGSNQTYERNEMSTTGIPYGARETPLQTLNQATAAGMGGVIWSGP